LSVARVAVAVLLIAGLTLAGEETRKDSSPLLGKPQGSFFALLVPDADQSARWYQENLGFTFVRKTTAPSGSSHTVMLEQNGVMIEIIDHRDSFELHPAVNQDARLSRGIRKVGITVSPQSFDRIFRHLQSRKAQFRGGIFQDEGLAVRSFIVLDNYGNLVQFFARLKG